MSPTFLPTLAFHDSEIHSVAMLADTLTLAFSAAYVQLADKRSGYMQSVKMEFRQATWVGPTADCVGRLSDGTLWVNGAPQAPLTLPYASAGPVRVELRFSNGANLAISAQAMVCRCTGDPQFVESFAC